MIQYVLLRIDIAVMRDLPYCLCQKIAFFRPVGDYCYTTEDPNPMDNIT